VADIGCTAEIVEVTKRYDDGRMDILTRGVERFEVLQVHDERPFLQAEFSVIEDEPGRAPSQMVEQAVRLHAEIVKLAGADVGGPEEGADHLSFLLAGSLPLDLDFKQKLLTTLSEPKRLQAVISYLEAVLPGLRRAAKARWN
jgi:Lon protease-like protein